MRVIASSCFHLEPFWKFQNCILSSEIGTFSKHQISAFQLLKRSNLVFRACLRRWEWLQALESIWGHFESFKSHFGAIFCKRFLGAPKSEILAFQPLKRSNLVFRANLRRLEWLQAPTSIWSHFENFKIAFWALKSELFPNTRFQLFSSWNAQI